MISKVNVFDRRRSINLIGDALERQFFVFAKVVAYPLVTNNTNNNHWMIIKSKSGNKRLVVVEKTFGTQKVNPI